MPILALIFGDTIVKAVAFPLTLTGLWGCYYYCKVHKALSQEAERLARREELQDRHGRPTAFRGLSPYLQSDLLPGESRRRYAEVFCTKFAISTHRLGVITGNVGCGKSSFACSAVHKWFSSNKVAVVVVRSPREIEVSGVGARRGRNAGVTKIRRLLGEIRSMLPTAPEGCPTLLILDQFEEILIDHQEEEQRLEIWSFLLLL